MNIEKLINNDHSGEVDKMVKYQVLLLKKKSTKSMIYLIKLKK